MWKRYRLKTKSIEDYRPLIFNPKYPWWCSGESEDYAVIIAFFPEDENIFKYWDDAFDVEFTTCKNIEFTDRFQKPKYFVES